MRPLHRVVRGSSPRSPLPFFFFFAATARLGEGGLCATPRIVEHENPMNYMQSPENEIPEALEIL